jgi:hypothetical protein
MPSSRVKRLYQPAALFKLSGLNLTSTSCTAKDLISQ